MTSEGTKADDGKKLSYLQMAQEAILHEKSRSGSSKQAILKYITSQHSLDPEKANSYLGHALKKGVESGQLKMAKESGKGSNSYKIGDAAKEENKKKPRKETKAAKENKKPGEKEAKGAKQKTDEKEKAGKEKKAPAKKGDGASTKKRKPLSSQNSSDEKTPKKAPAKSAKSKLLKGDKAEKKTPVKKIGKKAAATVNKKK
eukprot:TRINITY_DN52431_c0_g1_i1.p1 TRINITY_DN52431_c0_g1~~TRINITY_DN52431_c0_g1_i1.p1  ORF type:complete len:201 (-),score=73.00 TRINITY_DN52431_c0_g1_i1:196-798(-)